MCTKCSKSTYQGLNEPCHIGLDETKSVFGVSDSEIQTSLLSYKDYLEN